MRVDSDTKQRAFSVSKRQRGCQGHSSLDVTCPCVDTESRHCLGWAAALQKHPARCLAFLPDRATARSSKRAQRSRSSAFSFHNRLFSSDNSRRSSRSALNSASSAAQCGHWLDEGPFPAAAAASPPLSSPGHIGPRPKTIQSMQRLCRSAAILTHESGNLLLFLAFDTACWETPNRRPSSESLLAARAFFRRSRIALAVVSCMSQSTTKHTTKNVCIWLTIPLSYIKNVSFLTYNYF